MPGAAHRFAAFCRRIAPVVALVWALGFLGPLADRCCEAWAAEAGGVAAGHSHDHDAARVPGHDTREPPLCLPDPSRLPTVAATARAEAPEPGGAAPSPLIRPFLVHNGGPVPRGRISSPSGSPRRLLLLTRRLLI